MPEYLSPGVYVEEIEMGGKPIEGVSTSTAGFLGVTERGPIGPRLITGFTQYERLYGGYAWNTEEGGGSASFLPYAVAGFFANGGKRCFVGRILGEGNKAATGVLKGKGNTFDVSAAGPGSWGNRIGFAIETGSNAKPGQTADDTFKLRVFYWDSKPPSSPNLGDAKSLVDENGREPLEVEEFDDLSWDSDSPDYCIKRIKSVLIEVVEAPGRGGGGGGAAGGGGAGAGAAGGGGAGAGATGGGGGGKGTTANKLQVLKDGKDGKELTVKDYEGDADTPSGLAAFVDVDEISILCVPSQAEDELYEDLSTAMITHCELMKDRFAILQAKEDAGEIGTLFPVEGKVDSKYAAFYYPWIKINDPATNLPKLVPPGGHIAGIYARSDTERGVHKAPANEVVRGVTDLQFNINKGEQDILNPRGVNCIRSFVGRGIRVWGARTTSNDPMWKYVNIRRLFLFLEESIEEATQWVVFEPNNPALWARVRQSANDFLTRVWKDGALMGRTPEEAFFVKCDETTMDPSDIETGRLIILVGVAPTRPAEFVIFRLAQWRSGSAITE